MQNVTTFDQYMSMLVNMGVPSAATRTATYNTGDYEGGLILSTDPAQSHVPPSFISVPDVDTLKTLCGLQDSFFEANQAANTLPIPTATEALTAINNPLDNNVCMALSAYIFGNSQLVAPWKDTLNRLRFPMQVAVFTANVINVQAGNPLILKGTDSNPIGLGCDTLNIEAGGQVITQGPGTVTADVMNSAQAAYGAGDAPTTNLLSVGGDGGSGGDGSSTANAPAGPKGPDATTSGKSGCNAAGKGGQGPDAGDATDGGPGGTGGNASEINYSVTTMNGNYLAGSIGGNGGNGGNGGSGGNGGPGGAGGNGCRDCGQGPQGPGGKGGNAGKGGIGGNGGNGSTVYINYQNGSPTISTSTQKASGGNAGNAGNAGSPGVGNPNGAGGTTAPGVNGGTGGQPGKIIINGSASN
ncbi:hypothetical protein FAES_0394 [Fibrella aestuarina BUZ 2]|uniref:Uncharacterized protein n=1 Tax=Fibrella aestuarina BUZ 2 TaxID=1166018 RepID=I0K2Q3_9BACT|nr:hypothetical protein [Fibrella aestuarina]CCG98406.1 hypothetical protein FAES_0394 [Fibrella aestuarina BUZ 2]